MKRALIAIVLASTLTTFAEARGRCDGIHRCTCGSTQARHFGLPRFVNGHNLWLAVEWVRAFPHLATAQPGAVMYQHGGGPTGHVSRIESVLGPCRAMVTDERGTYERNTCSRGATFVDANGSTTFSARSHQRERVAVVSSDYMSRQGAGL